jgi:hypothetical protein
MIYECARCGFSTCRLSTYTDHTKRIRICRPVKSDVIPSRDNIIVRSGTDVNRFEAPTTGGGGGGGGGAAAAAAPSHVTYNNNTTNIMISVNTGDMRMKMKRFPSQDTSHLSPEQKRAILDTVNVAGFTNAVKSMLGTLYCNPLQPYNMNVIIEEQQTPVQEGDDTTDPVATKTMVFGADRNAPRKWVQYDTTAALELMLDEHADIIWNLPDDPDVYGTVPKRLVDKIDSSHDAKEHTTSKELITELSNKVQNNVRCIREKQQHLREQQMYLEHWPDSPYIAHAPMLTPT